MDLYVVTFGSPNGLVEFVNDTPVAQANIEKIENVDGRWYLFYWA
jgi:hypothetical protein